jgi:hypothetical protein
MCNKNGCTLLVINQGRVARNGNWNGNGRRYFALLIPRVAWWRSRGLGGNTLGRHRYIYICIDGSVCITYCFCLGKLDCFYWEFCAFGCS